MSQTLSGQNPKLTVDLDEMFGMIVPDSTSFRQRVGQAIIDKIRERTEDKNVDINGKNFRKYSKEYQESDDFKAYGKSADNVNLKQTGDMMGLMDIVDEGKNKITIGWNDGFQAKKAHGHITGHVGVERDFLGLPLSDLSAIAAEFKSELPLGDLDFDTTVDVAQEFQSKGSVRTFDQFIKNIIGDEDGG